MTKFKVGDKVVIVDIDDWQKNFRAPYVEYENGQTINIISPCESDDTVWAGVNNKHAVYWSNDQLELELVYNSPLYKALR